MKLSSLFKPPNAAQQERWERIKARGKKSYVLRYGVMGYGSLMFIFMTVAFWLRHSPFPRGMSGFYVDVLINLLIWPLAGYSWGLAMWRFWEDYYSDRRGQQPKNRT